MKSIILISNQALKAAEINPDAVIAIVTENDIAYNLARIASILLNETRWEISLFKSRKEAKKWIAKKVEEKYGITDIELNQL